MLYVEANGAKIPAIGLGTWELRGRTCARLVEQALRLGYRHIDTAQVYENERDVGEGLRAAHVRRDDLFVTTKVWTTHFAPNDLERSTKESLTKLRLSEVDLLLLHWPNPHVPLAETLGALAHAKKLGMARHIGVSNFTVALIDEAVMACSEPLVCDQVEYHPYLDQTRVREACARHGMAVVAYSPVAKGRIKNDETLVGIGRAHRKTPAQICLRWLVQQNVAAIPRDLEDRAVVGKHRHLRLRAVRRGDAADFRDGQRRRAGSPISVSRRNGIEAVARAAMLARWRAGLRRMLLPESELNTAMNPGRIIRAGITASAIAHLSVLVMVLFFTEVHPFGSVTAEPITVDIVTPAEVRRSRRRKSRRRNRRPSLPMASTSLRNRKPPRRPRLRRRHPQSQQPAPPQQQAALTTPSPAQQPAGARPQSPTGRRHRPAMRLRSPIFPSSIT